MGNIKYFTQALNNFFFNTQKYTKGLDNSKSKRTTSLLELIRFFSPLLWPRKCFQLKLFVILSIISVVVGCVVNVYVPIYSQKIVDSLSSFVSSSSLDFQHRPQQQQHKHFNNFKSTSSIEEFSQNTLLIFVGLKVLQGAGTLSLLNCIQSFLWIKLEQNAKTQVQLQFFEHLHKMSVQWQLGQKTGEILGTLERGTSGIATIIEHGLYSIIPTLVNIVIAVIYLTAKFNSSIGLIVIIQIVLYLYATVKITEWRSRFQKSLNTAEDEQKTQAMESLLNFETVKQYSNEEYEKQKYLKAINKFNAKEFSVLASITALQLVQLVIVHIGLLVGSWLIISLIIKETSLTVGDYVLFTAYMGQLILPLNYLGSHYRSLKISVTDLESMLETLRKIPDILISSDSKNLVVSEGQIEFRNVSFSYDSEKQTLSDISFLIPAKKTVALVGQSGGGKSSIIRLLTRLYDVDSGDILIDGQALKKMFPESIRKCTGVVPQDTILFHDTIGNNIKYAKLDATNSELVLAAQCAQIHNKISSLPLGYDTMVGERGLKLSGGEKQRINIARMFLKNPSIILLDEATSALDASTEKEILLSFERLCRNRTCLVVTHKLQSIQNVDEILVLKNGKISERGSHVQLIQLNGEYASMWKQQSKHSQ